jgi:hypothetical protein
MIRRALTFSLLTGVVLASTITLAQTRPAARAHPKSKATVSDAGATTLAGAAPAAPPRAETEARDAGVLESRTLDGGTRVFRFSEVEVEGHLRNPQLVYFLRRVRAEFAAGDLGHRSFMRELSDTRHDPSF